MNRFADIRGESVDERFDNYAANGREVLAKAEAGFLHCPERDDLPTAEEIVDLAIKQREHFIRLPCLVGMELRWRNGAGDVDGFPEDTLRRMVAFRLTDGVGESPGWFTHLVSSRPELVADVLTLYAGAAFKAGSEYVRGIYELQHDPAYRKVAVHAAPRLLAAFPVRARVRHLVYLKDLLKAALREARDPLVVLVAKKVSLRGMDAAQKVYWLTAGMLLEPQRYEGALWRHIGCFEARAIQLSHFFVSRGERARDDWPLSAGTMGKMIERIAPHAEIEWPSEAHWVSDAMNRGELVRALINRLAETATEESTQELDRLLGMPGMKKLKRSLEAARHELQQRKREREFRFPSVPEVAQVLANEAPVSHADLAALVLALLDDIAHEIRLDNDDGVRAFWNVANKQPIAPREENLCRDALLTRLRGRLHPLGVDCQPEADYANDNRADLRVSYRAEIELPIEIKCDSNGELWRSLRMQLIEQYAIAPKARGYGVYLVLWFGEKGLPRATDGGKKPRSPDELMARLEAQLDPFERQRIFVRVLDVSWPARSTSRAH